MPRPFKVPARTRHGTRDPASVVCLPGMLFPWAGAPQSTASARPGQSCRRCGPVPRHLINATCRSARPAAAAARSPPPPAPPREEGGGCKDGRGDIFIVSDTGCPRLSYFMQRAKEASLCYAAAGQAAQPGEGKDGRNAAGRGCVHAWARACECVHTRATGHRFIQPFPLRHGGVHPNGRGRKVACCLQTCLFF